MYLYIEPLVFYVSFFSIKTGTFIISLPWDLVSYNPSLLCKKVKLIDVGFYCNKEAVAGGAPTPVGAPLKDLTVAL